MLNQRVYHGSRLREFVPGRKCVAWGRLKAYLFRSREVLRKRTLLAGGLAIAGLATGLIITTESDRDPAEEVTGVTGHHNTLTPTPASTGTLTATAVSSGYTINGGTPVPTDWIVEIIRDHDLPEVPNSPWSEQVALDYSLGWIVAHLPSFTWNVAAARRLTGYQTFALENNLDVATIPTLSPSAAPEWIDHYSRSDWYIAFRVPEPIRYRDFATALGTHFGDADRADSLFTEGYAILQENSGEFTASGILNYVDNDGNIVRDSMVQWTLDDLASLPTTIP